MSDQQPDDNVGLPADATLKSSNGFVWGLKTGGASIPISPQTASSSTGRNCLLVGRQAKTVDIRVDHGSISRKHAALYYSAAASSGDDDCCILQDLGSKKGTSVNGTLMEKKQRLVLNEGDQIVFGHARERVFTVVKQVKKDEDEKEKEETTTATNDNTTTNNVTTEGQTRIEQILQDYELPIRERMTLVAQSERRHRVTCLAVDHAGNRLVVGTTDGILRMYDFAGMRSHKLEPFKMIAVEEGQGISDLCFSNTGDRILASTTGSQPYVLDRDGGEIIKFVRGDPYVIQKDTTVGHTAEVTGVQWHPFDRDTVLTSSIDGSIRLWNLNGKTQFKMLMSDTVFQPKSSKGQRTTVACLTISPHGREFAVGTSCGSIQIWSCKAGSSRPAKAVYGAHKSVDALVYSPNGQLLASRSVQDSRCLVWNANKLSKSSCPVAICQDAPTLFAGHCRPSFSPNNKILCVGVSFQRKGEGDKKESEIGSIKFFQLPSSKQQADNTNNNTALDAVLELPVSNTAAVTDILWPAKTNQLYLGTSDGQVEVLYDTVLSERGGALLAHGKGGRPQNEKLAELFQSRAPTGSAALVANHAIIAPNATRHKRKRRDEEDPSETLKPQAPGAKFRMGRLNNM
ncbi:WD repeat-containing protein 70 [Seminavis robusta]|uniref:WD repeat-containing protein 70 n=1 Tax=Seminavis robusta TaxID=568900 RepID=A0A9N8D6C8_9STRA|nr:WD repeat-containing protein 70 [Seminavis robusta]|eukprot:Sro16_g011890.1 WD repeat-containing protein 70 (628) ;mRNA; f:153507-155504